MKFIATIEDKERPNIQAIAAELRHRGAQIEQVMRITGIITGSFSNSFDKLKIKGISSVETDKAKSALR